MLMRNAGFLAATTTALVMLSACSKPPSATDEPAAARRDQLTRAEFNALAVRRNLPFFWVEDRNGNGAADDDEVVPLLFYPAFAGNLDAAYDQLLAAKSEAPLDASQPDGQRRALVRKDLDAGRTSLVYTDLSSLSPGEKAFAREMLAASQTIDALYATQTGIAGFAAQLPQDPESHSLYRRNWGPQCAGPETEKVKECSAIPGSPVPVVGMYPASIDGIAQAAPGFCALLQQPGRDPALIDPFTVVRENGGKLEAIPYTAAYTAQMADVATRLETAADALKDANEQPLVDYLRAAATAFRDNNWWPADEAWARMSAANSKWFLRVAPDEVYWDPCGFKAGFHLTFARINQGSLEWQAKLSKVQQDMEAAVAKASGPPYRARKVGFDLPEFIDIVTNSGYSRSNAFGGTIGQSLPNFGPVAKESRNRTVAMVNLFNEPDSVATRRKSAESIFDKESLADYSDDATIGDFSTILHEATHNLGPSNEYAVAGKTGRVAFGGPLASLMEELKAQTGALYLNEVLRSQGIIDDAFARHAYVDGITWAMGHISQGMWSEPGHQRKTYSQLAAIQIGILMDQGVLTWNPEAMAANGTDKGAFHIDSAKIIPAVQSMMKQVGGIKARADRRAAEALAAKYVDTDRIPQSVIVERFARSPRASLVYSVRF
jgi:hypothetical protein